MVDNTNQTPPKDKKCTDHDIPMAWLTFNRSLSEDKLK